MRHPSRILAGLMALLGLGGAAWSGEEWSSVSASALSGSNSTQPYAVQGLRGARGEARPELNAPGAEAAVEYRYTMTSEGWKWGQAVVGASTEEELATGDVADFISRAADGADGAKSVTAHRALTNDSLSAVWLQPAANGETPLHRASRVGLSDVVTALLDRGGDPSVAGLGGSTPLHAAAGEGKVDATQVLLSRGAPKNKVDAHGRTPLFLAAQAGKTKVTT